jgi:hypothetical protein
MGVVSCGTTVIDNGVVNVGAVNWDTTTKTASFTAVSGNGYFVNTTSTAITVTLPAGSAGDIVGISDYASTFQTNNVTITPNGADKINGVNQNATLDTQGIAVTLVYVDSTRGWKSVTGSDDNTSGVTPFINATGGTITESGDYRIHTFTGPGTFSVSSVAPGPSGNPNTVDYLVVAGGGGGGGAIGGGSGAGGYRESSGNTGCYTSSPLATPTGITITATDFPITVGAGGTGRCAPSGPCAARGANSIFSTITSAGGGAETPGLTPGGSGAGEGHRGGAGGTGNTPPVSPPQGQNGGSAPSPAGYAGAGGGGAIAAGTSTSGGGGSSAGPGGNGTTSSINGTPTARAGGGGGGFYITPGGGTGGTGGGGNGGGTTGQNGSDATVNTGGGGGGGGFPDGNGGNGGSGIVIIRYKFQ